jgi:large conductance mechanosensitive channel
MLQHLRRNHCMSSYPVEDPEKTVIKSKITVTQETILTETAALSAETEAEVEEIKEEFTRLGKGFLKYLEGFRTFILRGNVVDLAIGIVVGAAFTAVVNALVSDIITPLIPVSKSGSLSTLDVRFAYVDLHIGAFINAIISFLIVAAVLYFFVVQPVNSLVKFYHPKETAPETRECPFCFQAVNVKATRCPFCTSHMREEKENEGKEPVLELPESLEGLSNKLADQIFRKASMKLEAAAGSEGSATSEAEPAKE